MDQVTTTQYLIVGCVFWHVLDWVCSRNGAGGVFEHARDKGFSVLHSATVSVILVTTWPLMMVLLGLQITSGIFDKER